MQTNKEKLKKSFEDYFWLEELLNGKHYEVRILETEYSFIAIAENRKDKKTFNYVINKAEIVPLRITEFELTKKIIALTYFN